jgi:hypothetical protein
VTVLTVSITNIENLLHLCPVRIMDCVCGVRVCVCGVCVWCARVVCVWCVCVVCVWCVCGVWCVWCVCGVVWCVCGVCVCVVCVWCVCGVRVWCVCVVCVCGVRVWCVWCVEGFTISLNNSIHHLLTLSHIHLQTYSVLRLLIHSFLETKHSLSRSLSAYHSLTHTSIYSLLPAPIFPHSRAHNYTRLPSHTPTHSHACLSISSHKLTPPLNRIPTFLPLFHSHVISRPLTNCHSDFSTNLLRPCLTPVPSLTFSRTDSITSMKKFQRARVPASLKLNANSLQP